jgi:hypothetical protein
LFGSFYKLDRTCVLATTLETQLKYFLKILSISDASENKIGAPGARNED